MKTAQDLRGDFFAHVIKYIPSLSSRAMRPQNRRSNNVNTKTNASNRTCGDTKERRFSFLFLSHFEPLPFRGMSLWSQGIYSSLPRYLPCISISRIGSALPHRVNSHQTHSVDNFVCSRSHAFHGGNHTLRRINPTHRESNPLFSPP